MGYIGKTECQQCGREVDVSENITGHLYYRCAPCGVRVQQTNARGDRLLRGKTRVFSDPDEAAPALQAAAEQPAAAPVNRSESPRIDEPKPAAKPAADKPAVTGAMAAFWGRK